MTDCAQAGDVAVIEVIVIKSDSRTHSHRNQVDDSDDLGSDDSGDLTSSTGDSDDLGSDVSDDRGDDDSVDCGDDDSQDHAGDIRLLSW
jgi:hypothetical protein